LTLHALLQPFLEAELALGNRIKQTYDHGDTARVELTDPLHVEELRARLRWPASVAVYEQWGPREPSEIGVRVETEWQAIAGPHPMFAALRPTLEELSRTLVAGTGIGAVTDEDVRKLMARWKRKKSGKPALPPPEAYQPDGCGDGRACIGFIDRSEEGVSPRTWRLLFHAWSDQGRQPDVFELHVREARPGTLILDVEVAALHSSW
jgi:hypothetical protein